MARHTKFGHIPDLTCVYRVYNTSTTFTTFNSPNFLRCHIGLVSIKRYLNELFPGELGFSEEWAHDYIAYKKFLLAVFNFDYRVAKEELASLINLNAKEKKAKRYSNTVLGFYIFCIAKRIKIWYEVKKQT